MSIITQPNYVSSNEIHSLNSQARVSTSRGSAMSLMNKVLMQSNVDIMSKYGTSWLTITSEIALMNYESESMRRLAAYNFSQILKLCSQVPDIARDISSDYINVIFRQLLSSGIKESLPCLKCLKSILKYLPGPCGEFKGKLVKFLLPQMLSNNSIVQDKAISCWCFIPIIGGGGTDRKDHVSQWERQFNEALDAFDYISTSLTHGVQTRHTKEPADPMLGSISLPFHAIPRNEPEHSKVLLQRFTILCKCISQMLGCRYFNAPVKIPFEKILSSVQSCCSITPQALGYTSEGIMRAKHLIDFHLSCLKLLRSFMQSCSHYLVQYAGAVNRVFVNLLDLWKSPPPVVGQAESCTPIRTAVYDSAILWVQTCGWKSQFLSDDVNIAKVILSHWVDDISPPSENTKSSESEAPQPSRKKRKKAKPVVKEKETFDHQINSKLQSSALKAARLCVYSHGSGLPVLVHKTLQESTIKMLLTMMKKPAHPYHSCDSSRKELFHLLLSLTVSPHPSWPPPLHFALNFFQQLSSCEKNLAIRTLCVEASTTLSLIVRPRAPSLQRASIQYNDECVKAYKESSQSTLDTVHSLDLDTQDDHNPVQVDAQTSTDDLAAIDLVDDGFDMEETAMEKAESDLLENEFDQASSLSEVEEDEISSSEDEGVIVTDPVSHQQEEHSPDKRKADEECDGAQKRLRIDEVADLDKLDAEDTRKIEDESSITEDATSHSDEDISVATMIADFMNVKPDQSHESEPCG